jgi:hypothetical protein
MQQYMNQILSRDKAFIMLNIELMDSNTNIARNLNMSLVARRCFVKQRKCAS